MTSPFAETVARFEPLAERFTNAGFSLYLVGGIVRDLLLDSMAESSAEVQVYDFDFTTDARPPEIKGLLSRHAKNLWTQGEKFGTIGGRVFGAPVEITTFRAESYDSDSRKPVVEFGDHLHTDLSRRDFTINAMAVHATTGELIDPFGGQADLASGVIQTPLDPSISFSDDPLRMLRAARFSARFGFTLAAEVLSSAQDLASRMEIVSSERINVELVRVLELSDPSPGLRFLTDAGLAPWIVPGIASTSWRTGCAAVSRFDVDGWAASDRANGRLACLLSGLETNAADTALADLRFSSDRRKTVRSLHRALGLHPGRAESDLRGFVLAVGFPLVELALATREAVGVSSDERELAAAIETLGSNEDLSDFGPSLSGQEIMEVLGIEPGPRVGEAARYLTEQRVLHGPMNRAESEAALREWVG